MAESSVPHMLYFPFAARGELSRLVCAVGGLILDETYPGKGYKTSTIFGFLPNLQHGSLLLAQSGAIEKYLANIAPLYASLTPDQRAVDNMYLAFKEEVLQDITAKPMGKKSEPIFTVLEGMVPADGFILGQSFPTIADFSVLIMVESVLPFKPLVKKAGFNVKKFPKVQALIERTKRVPGVQKYLATSKSFRLGIPGVIFKLLSQLCCTKCCCRRAPTRRQATAEGSGGTAVGAGTVSTSGPPEMFYFPLAGRGELSRLICAAGGLELKDTNPGQDYKSKVGFVGSVPTLKHGGLSLCQSDAIETYLASIAPKFKGLTAQQRAIDDMYIHTKLDLLDFCSKIVLGNEAAKSQASKKVQAAFNTFLGPIERMLPAQGFVNGEAFPTAADLVLVNVLEATMPFGKAVDLAGGIDFKAKFPRAYDLAQRVKQADGVKEYLQSSKSIKGT